MGVESMKEPASSAGWVGLKLIAPGKLTLYTLGRKASSDLG
jgi:hypothetical protein